MIWQAIETAPKVGSYLVSDGRTVAHVVPVWGGWSPCVNGSPACTWGSGDFSSDDVEIDFEPTNWMPLPEPPAEKGVE